MDETTLAYHTKLHQWYDLHRLNRSGDMANLKLPEDGAHLTPQRAVEIDLWRKEVNKIFVKPKKAENKSEFWRCHMSAPTSASKHYSVSGDPRRVKSARFFSGRSKSGVVDINSLPTHLAEMSIHYNRERSKLYNTPVSSEFFVKGRKQELHLPQSFRAIRGQMSDDGMTRDEETHVSVPQEDRDNDDMRHDETPEKARVADRSKSNDLLNVMSIDDCKMALRYRPQRILSTFTEKNPSNQGESTSDDKTAEHQLKISEGSEMTSVSPNKLQSVLSAQRIKHKQLIINGNNLSPQRPHSAILARAFDTILQDKSMLAAPLHPKEVRFFAGSKEWRHHPTGKHIYHRLNSTLKTKMNNVVNARWDTLRSKDSGSARVQYSRGSDSRRFSKRSTATDSLISDDSKQL